MMKYHVRKKFSMNSRYSDIVENILRKVDEISRQKQI